MLSNKEVIIIVILYSIIGIILSLLIRIIRNILVRKEVIRMGLDIEKEKEILKVIDKTDFSNVYTIYDVLQDNKLLDYFLDDAQEVDMVLVEPSNCGVNGFKIVNILDRFFKLYFWTNEYEEDTKYFGVEEVEPIKCEAYEWSEK